MINYKKESFFANLKYSLIEFYNKNKWLIIIIGLLLAVALLTGIFTSIKLYNLDNDIDLKKYSISAFLDGSVYTFKNLFLRFLSLVLVCGLLFVFSLNIWVAGFGYALLIYRGFLITLNCTFAIIKCGFSGSLFPILIIFLSQVLLICLLGILFIVLLNNARYKKRFGCVLAKDKYKLLYLLITILIVTLVETLLLIIFKPTTILII